MDAPAELFSKPRGEWNFAIPKARLARSRVSAYSISEFLTAIGVSS